MLTSKVHVKMNHWWKRILTLVLLVQYFCSIFASDDDLICGSLGPGVVMHSDYKSGTRRCCLNTTCQKGFEPMICTIENATSTSCRVCPDGTYQPEETFSADMKHCEAKKICLGNRITLHEESKIRDSECVCNDKSGFCNPNRDVKNPRICRQMTCPNGMTLRPNCTCSNTTEEEEPGNTSSGPCTGNDQLCKVKKELVTKEQSFSKTGETVPADGSQSTGALSRLITVTQMDKETDWTVVFIPLAIVCAVLLLITLVVLGVMWKCYHRTTSETIPSADSRTSSEDTCLMQVLCEEMKCNNRPKEKEKECLMNGVHLSDREEAPPLCQTIAPLCTAGNGQTGAPPSAAGNGPVNVITDPVHLMKETDKEKLNQNRACIVGNLMFSPQLWSVLMSNKTVTSEMREDIDSSCSSNSKRADALICNLLKRDSYAFVTFVASLIYTKQEHLANLLDQVLVQQLNSTYPDTELLIDYISHIKQT